MNSIACNNNGTWVAVGVAGTIIVSSDNGNTWIKKNSGTDKQLNSIAYNNGTWIAIGENGTILRSTDTAVWEP